MFPHARIVPLIAALTQVACPPNPADTPTTGSSSSGAMITATTGAAPTTAPTDTGVDPDETSTGLAPGTSTGEPDDSTSTGEPAPVCAAEPDPTPYHSGNASLAWVDGAVDEDCTISESTAGPAGLLLRMDCPVHAMNNAGEQVEVTLQNGPLPGEPPQAGEVLHVYYQFGNDQIPQVGMLFLLRGEQLIYFAVNGIFVDKFDVYYANKYSQPLAIDLRPGDCPTLANPAWRAPGVDPVCEYEAPAQMEVVADGVSVFVPEGASAEVQAGDDRYLIDVRLARSGQNCGQDGHLGDLDRQTLAGALLAR